MKEERREEEGGEKEGEYIGWSSRQKSIGKA